MLGLALMLYILGMGVTGMLLSLRQPIDALLSPAFHRLTSAQTKPVPTTLQKVVDNALFSLGDVALRQVILPEHDDQPIWLYVQGKAKTDEVMEVSVDPRNGDVLGKRIPKGTFFHWVYELHTEWFVHRWGKVITGVLALPTMLLLVTGLMAWWPRGNVRWKTRFSINRQSRRRMVFDLHGLVGALFFAPQMLLVISGFALAFYLQLAAVLQVGITGKPIDPFPRPPISTQPALPMQDYVNAVATAMPDAYVERIDWPRRDGTPVVIRGKYPDAAFGRGEILFAMLDWETAQIIWVEDPHKPRIGLAIMAFSIPIHFGEWGGLPVRLFYAVLGLLLVLQAMTGGWLWYQRKRRR
jgi:uncharacterized iron-regulated membrane protein